jgi:hypothetical protein
MRFSARDVSPDRRYHGYCVGHRECKIVRLLEKAPVVRLLHDEPEFSETFMLFLLQTNIRVEEEPFKMRKRRWPLKQSPPITAPRNRCKVVSASFIAC